jgi:hypothetical protein
MTPIRTGIIRMAAAFVVTWEVSFPSLAYRMFRIVITVRRCTTDDTDKGRDNKGS